MPRAAWLFVCVAACTLLACGRDDPGPGSESGPDTTHVQGRTDVQQDSHSVAARVEGPTGGAQASRDRLAALWQAVLAHERIAARGGWPTPPAGSRLRLGDTGPAVAVLKHRLVASGDLQSSLFDRFRRRSSRELFDTETAAALRRFQERHGLEPDGILGRQTGLALDVPAAARARQLRANLARAQQAPRVDVGRAVVVNIPEYHLRCYEEGRAVLDMRVVVGTAADPTPSFSDLMTYVVFRPFWSIPTSIALEEIVPAIRSDPRILQRKNLEVVVAAEGDSVQLADADSVDWSRFEQSGYTLRRRPGRRNPLGDVKFMFPNPYSVYLHDTPQDNLFRKEDRRFSHGCVRVEKPLDLAEFVLRGKAGWDRDRICAAMWMGETQTVSLPQPIPTHIVYWTAWVDDYGRVQFRDDIYGLDGPAAADVAATP